MFNCLANCRNRHANRTIGKTIGVIAGSSFHSLIVMSLALTVLLGNPGRSHGFGINVEAEVKLGDRFWIIRKLRKSRGAKLRQGIHERITIEALNDAERRRSYSAQHPNLRQQVIYGLLFNDDPGGYLFPKTGGNPRGYKYTRDSGGSVVNGIKWMKKFGVVVARMKRLYILKKEEFSKRKLLIGRLLRSRGTRERPQLEEKLQNDILWASHFGDLQYLHSMGQGDETRAKILAKMRGYAHHAWAAATGVMTFDCFKAEIKRVKMPDASGNNQDSASANTGCPLIGSANAKRKRLLMQRFDEFDALYHTNDASEFRYRALGSILHMIQDSYAKGHTVREGWNKLNSGRVMYFQNYAEQDGAKHGVFDTHPTKNVDNWNQISGAITAMQRSSTLITFFTLQCSWKPNSSDRLGCPAAGVESYLFNEVFATVSLPNADKATRSHDELRQTN